MPSPLEVVTVPASEAFSNPNVPLVSALKVPANATLVYISGCIGVDLQGKVVEGGVEAQCLQVLKNLSAVANASGSDKDHIIKCNIYLKDMNDFGRINKVYGEFFAPYKPTRTCVEVARLPLDVLVEIEGVAMVKP
ncbi:Endoribonuclease L-PSP [Atractiella rhizophila]|nr:Endoribonuclease L-PSP [Atractiella rhizophila]